jgi:hypothetical protein
MTVNTVRRDDVEITYETFGPEEGRRAGRRTN